jgi:replication-associated recombination protein RarA
MQGTLDYPQSLTSKYQPKTLTEFVGLEKPKKILSKFAAKPYANSFLFVGPSGTGKTTMALALAKQVQGEVIHIPSQHASVAEVEDAIRRCWYVPMVPGGFHVVLVDEADQMTDKAQLLFLSKLDATSRPPNTIFIFTCNETENLEPRFLSRTLRVEFSSYGIASEAVEYLGKIWDTEANGATRPNLAQIMRDSRNNLRDAVTRIESELLAA